MSIAQDVLHFYKNTKGLEGGCLQEAIIDENRHTTEDQDFENETTTYVYADSSCIVMSNGNTEAYASKD